MTDKEQRTQIAKTILEQFGGSKFLAMTGAKTLVAQNDGLSFRLPSRFAKDGINYVRVRLTPADLYDIEYGKVTGIKYKVIKEVKGLYWDGLQEYFTATTGLNTHL